MSILSLEDFMKNYNLKNDTMNESELQRVSLILNILKIPKYIQIKDS